MAHHHLLPFLALILLILPSSSQSAQKTTPALFSDEEAFLDRGLDLTNGQSTLSLKEDCGLHYYNATGEVKSFSTATKDKNLGCELRINDVGQLVVRYGDGEKKTLGKAGEKGTYGLLFRSNYKLALFRLAYRIDSTNVNQITSTPERLKQATSNNFIDSHHPDHIDGSATNGDTLIASNHDASAHITSKCTLLVQTSANSHWETEPAAAEPTTCKLYLTDRGVLSLLRKDSNGTLHTQWTGGAFMDKKVHLAALRQNGALDIFGFMEDIIDISDNAGSVAENIKMVTV